MILTNKYLVWWIAAIALFVINSSHAATIKFTVAGYVDTSDNGVFGLPEITTTTSGFVSADGEFDNDNLVADCGSGCLSAPLDDFNITVGTSMWGIIDDIGTPRIGFINEQFSYISFVTNFGEDSTFQSFFSGLFEGNDDDFLFMEGYWDASSYSVVPVPASVWLFGSGLLGLAGVARKKTV